MKTTRTFGLPCACAALAFAVLAPLGASAQATPNPPGLLSFQGFVTDANGTALALTAPTNYSIQFHIYDAPTGGHTNWGEAQTVTVDRGYFSVLLGQGAALTDGSPWTNNLGALFSGATASDRYVGLTAVGIGTEIQPRLRLLASPYSFLAASANALASSASGQPVISTVAGALTLNLTNANLNGNPTFANGTPAFANGLNVTGGTATFGTGLTANNNVAVNNANVTVTNGAFVGNGSIPLGGIIMWSGTAAPPGWALCDGSTNSGRITPDLRGRFVVGQGLGQGLSNRTLGSTGGEETHTLAASEMPAHTHATSVASAGGHAHDFHDAYYNEASAPSSLPPGWSWDTYGVTFSGSHGGVDNDNQYIYWRPNTTASAGDHTHSVTVSNTGGGGAHNTMPPFYALAYIMRVQ